MKNFILRLLIVLISFSLMACGNKQELEELIAEQKEVELQMIDIVIQSMNLSMNSISESMEEMTSGDYKNSIEKCEITIQMCEDSKKMDMTDISPKLEKYKNKYYDSILLSSNALIKSIKYIQNNDNQRASDQLGIAIQEAENSIKYREDFMNFIKYKYE